MRLPLFSTVAVSFTALAGSLAASQVMPILADALTITALLP